FAQNLGEMIVLRAIQGFSGGVLIPLSFTVIITLLPKAKQPIGMALFALFAISNFMNVTLSGDVAGDQLFWANIVRAVGQAVILAPLAAVATAGIGPEHAPSASDLFNMI